MHLRRSCLGTLPKLKANNDRRFSYLSLLAKRFSRSNESSWNVFVQHERLTIENTIRVFDEHLAAEGAADQGPPKVQSQIRYTYWPNPPSMTESTGLARSSGSSQADFLLALTF